MPGRVFQFIDGLILRSLDIRTDSATIDGRPLVVGRTYADRAPLVVIDGMPSDVGEWLRMCRANVFSLEAEVPMYYYYLLPVEAVETFGAVSYTHLARDADFVGGRLDAVYFARVRCVEVLFEPFLVDRCIMVVLVFGRVFGTFGVGHFAQPQVAQADVGVLHRAEVDTQQVARFAPEELLAAFADAHAILLPCVGGLERRGDDRPFDVGNHFAVDFRPEEELYVVRATVGLIFEGQYVEVGGDVSVEGNGAEIGIFSGSMDCLLYTSRCV